MEKYNWSLANAKNSSDGKVLFVSQYAPLIRVNLTADEIKKLTRDTSVQSIYYSPDVEAAPESNVSIPLIRANYTRDTLGYTGEGIRIGLFEANGLPDTSTGYFNNSKIIMDTGVSQVTTEHATLVAAIMVGKTVTTNGITYRGIVPDAKLYATYINGERDWRSGIEWLLSQNVCVINMSANLIGASSPNGNNERWIDHIAINHSVHFVNSAGNIDKDNPDGEVTSPGMAYNVITVGNLNDKNTSSQSDDVIRNTSCYVEYEGTNKPDLVAPGTDITYGTITKGGTSFAAPHVTAVVAQLCQRYAPLKIKQAAVKAILTASINHNYISYTPTDSEYDIYGAGMIDARSALHTVSNSQYLSASFAASSMPGIRNYYDFNVTDTTNKRRVSLSWLRHSSIPGLHVDTAPNVATVADLAVTIYDPNGNYLTHSMVDGNNTQIVEFVPTMTGTYQIMVTVISMSPQPVNFGLAWY